MKILVIFVIVPICLGVKLPSSLKKCNRKDPNFDACLRDAMENTFKEHGNEPIPEISLPVLDPISFPALDISAGSGPVAFDQHYTDCKLYGLSNIKLLEKTKLYFDKKEFDFEVKVPFVTKISQYNFNGRLLVLPIRGHGRGNITLIEPYSFIHLKMSEYQKGGSSHFKVDRCEIQMTPSLVKFQFDNLFDGNKQLGDNINNVLNENWEDIYKDVGAGYREAFCQVFQQIASEVFGKVSIAELFD